MLSLGLMNRKTNPIKCRVFPKTLQDQENSAVNFIIVTNFNSGSKRLFKLSSL